MQWKDIFQETQNVPKHYTHNWKKTFSACYLLPLVWNRSSSCLPSSLVYFVLSAPFSQKNIYFWAKHFLSTLKNRQGPDNKELRQTLINFQRRRSGVQKTEMFCPRLGQGYWFSGSTALLKETSSHHLVLLSNKEITVYHFLLGICRSGIICVL